MKSGKIVIIIAGLIIVAGIVYAFNREKESASSVSEPIKIIKTTTKNTDIINVEEYIKNPEKYKGEFVLRGVVAGLKKSEGVFGIIDAEEFETCGTLSCSDEIIPVWYKGELPQPKTIVKITGEMVKREKGRIIKASRVEIVK